MFLLKICVAIAFSTSVTVSARNNVYCKDPDMGSTAPGRRSNHRKFLLFGGAGAGIGNFLIFYPAAFYFAALTGRDIIIADDSLVGEMCKVLYCGFPHFSNVASAFPSILNAEKLNRIRGAKAWDFHRHMSGESILDDSLIRADGYKYMSGWYVGYNHTDECISQLTGCRRDDISCHDRHALQKLVRGPFRTKFTEEEESKLIGVPSNLRHGIMTLPHSYAPRLDASIHLRCQFRHFEYLVGPEDTLWPAAMKEQNDWLNSKDFNAGEGLYKAIEAKIMAELPNIKKERQATKARRRMLVDQYWSLLNGQRQLSLTSTALNTTSMNTTQIEFENEHDIYRGDETKDKIYVYLASDNERVKDALTQYLLGHEHIAVMRVRSDHHIVHAKNLGYLKRNSSGVMNLVLDWYCMSLSNIIFAWRRDTDLLSTFAQSAQRVSGNAEAINNKIYHEGDSSNDVQSSNKAKGFQLHFKNGRTVWSEF